MMRCLLCPSCWMFTLFLGVYVTYATIYDSHSVAHNHITVDETSASSVDSQIDNNKLKNNDKDSTIKPTNPMNYENEHINSKENDPKPEDTDGHENESYLFESKVKVPLSFYPEEGIVDDDKPILKSLKKSICSRKINGNLDYESLFVKDMPGKIQESANKNAQPSLGKSTSIEKKLEPKEKLKQPIMMVKNKMELMYEKLKSIEYNTNPDEKQIEDIVVLDTLDKNNYNDEEPNYILDSSDRTDPDTTLLEYVDEDVDEVDGDYVNPSLNLAPEATLKIPDCSNHNKRDPILIVSTLDGQISGINYNTGNVIWSQQTGTSASITSLLTSSISKIEVTSRGEWVRLIPSLDGGIYRFDGESVEPLPVTADTLLHSSYKFNEDTIFTGGKVSQVIGLSPETGEVKYVCDMNGCPQNPSAISSNEVLIVKRVSQTVRAIDPKTGGERWNFSVGQHEVNIVHGDCDSLINEDDSILPALKFVLPDSIIIGWHQKGQHATWRQQLSSPIVSAWSLSKGSIEKIDLFSSDSIPALLPQEEEISVPPEKPISRQPALYVGIHHNQLYIQQNTKAQPSIVESAVQPLTTTPTVTPSVDVRFSRVQWQPYLATALSRTPVVHHSSNKHPLLLDYDKKQHSTDLVVKHNFDYPYDNGYYLYGDEETLFNESDRWTHQKTEEEEGLFDRYICFEIGPEFWWKALKWIVIYIFCHVFFLRIVYKRLCDRLEVDMERRFMVLAEQRASQFARVFLQSILRENGQIMALLERVCGARLAIFPPDQPTEEETRPSLPPEGTQRQDSSFSSRYTTDFEPIRCLGKGGFGVVFHVKNKLDENEYAIKRIVLPSKESSAERVKREVRALAKLNHAHIVRYYNSWLETPPIGWEKESDTWWKDGNVVSSSMISPNSDESEGGRSSLLKSSQQESLSGVFKRLRVPGHEVENFQRNISVYNQQSTRSDSMDEDSNIVYFGKQKDNIDPVDDDDDSIQFKDDDDDSVQFKDDSVEDNDDSVQFKDDSVEDNDDSVQFKDDSVEDNDDSVQFKDDSVEVNDDSVQFKDDSVEDNDDSVQFKDDSVEDNDDSVQFKDDSVEDNDDSVQFKDDSVEDDDSVQFQDDPLDDDSVVFNNNSERNYLEKDRNNGSCLTVENIASNNYEKLTCPVSKKRSSSFSISRCNEVRQRRRVQSNGNPQKSNRPSSLDLVASNSDPGKSALNSKSNKERVSRTTPIPRTYMYIQMELCMNESLKDWLFNNQNRDIFVLYNYFNDIISAVEYVHDQALMHRDLKPSNIFFSLDGEIKIGDFGLVTTIAEENNAMTPMDSDNREPTVLSIKQRTLNAGTHLYMSPEQMNGLSYNYKVDIFSLGLIFFEMLEPFSTEMERRTVMLKAREQKFTPKFTKQYPQETELLQLMLHHDPSKRLTTRGIRCRKPLSDFQRDLQAIKPEDHFNLNKTTGHSRSWSGSFSFSNSSTN